MALSYATMTADGGRITPGRHGRITDLAVQQPVQIPLSPGTDEIFGPPPDAATLAERECNGGLPHERPTHARPVRAVPVGRPIDGIVALDVPALSRLLSVTGPVVVPGLPAPVSADNAATVLLHDLYEGIPAGGGADQGDRYERIGEVIGWSSRTSRPAVKVDFARTRQRCSETQLVVDTCTCTRPMKWCSEPSIDMTSAGH